LYKVKILSGYRVSIPKDVRERLGLKIGDELILEVEGAKIILKVPFLPEDPVFGLCGLVEVEEQEMIDAETAVVLELKKKMERSEGPCSS